MFTAAFWGLRHDIFPWTIGAYLCWLDTTFRRIWVFFLDYRFAVGWTNGFGRTGISVYHLRLGHPLGQVEAVHMVDVYDLGRLS